MWGFCQVISAGNVTEKAGTTFSLNRTSANTTKLVIYGIIGTSYYTE